MQTREVVNNNANDLDDPPVNDPITKLKLDYLSDVWRDYIAALVQTLSNYLSQFGIFPPNLTQKQIDSIVSPQNGQMVYNVTADTMQYYKISSGTWISF